MLQQVAYDAEDRAELLQAEVDMKRQARERVTCPHLSHDRFTITTPAFGRKSWLKSAQKIIKKKKGENNIIK